MMFSKRVRSLSPSATFAMAQKSNELKAQGVDIVNMSVGEPDFSTPEHIKEIGEKAIMENYTRYSPVSGYKGLKEAICGKLSKVNALNYSPDEIIVSNGAKQSICNAVCHWPAGTLIATLGPPGDNSMDSVQMRSNYS